MTRSVSNPKAVLAPGAIIRELRKPRVLIERCRIQDSETWTPIYDHHSLADRLADSIPTVVAVDDVTQHNLNEWDCVVTSVPPVALSTRREHGQDLHSWKNRYPDHVSVLCVVESGGMEILDAFPRSAEGDPELPSVVIVRDPNVTGYNLRHVEGLSDVMRNLVRSHLVPAAEEKYAHPVFRRWENDQSTGHDQAPELEPFLLGPDDSVLACSYQRSPQASAWLLPSHIGDLLPWIVGALTEWHSQYPSRFPVAPDWHRHAKWQSAEESALAQRVQQVNDRLQAQQAQAEADLTALRKAADAAQQKANVFERALLTADGDLLADAVACAFATLGFHVVDMDLHWPTNDRREDLRVFDRESDWEAIVEVKGSSKGAKETELVNFARWADRFKFEHGRTPKARWFVTNHHRTADPETRPVPFAGKHSLLASFGSNQGTVIDTRALFDILKIVEANPEAAPAARELLKNHTPALTRVTAADLPDSASVEAEDAEGAEGG